MLLNVLENLDQNLNYQISQEMVKYVTLKNLFFSYFLLFWGFFQNVKNAGSLGKQGFISKIDQYIPGFKAFVCCMQTTAIGRVLNKWGKKLLDWHENWHG